MPKRVTYTCDECDGPMTEVYGPLFMTLGGEREPQVNHDCVFCSLTCLVKWVARLAEGVKA